MALPSILEVIGDQVARLDDHDLRNLVRRLCEAELERYALPKSAVTAGGNQNASDGGIDVRVALTGATPKLDFIPRPQTGYQAKATDMNAGEITSEMRHGGTARPAIAALATLGGAYVIVSSKGTTTDTGLNARKHAMSAAVSDLPNADALQLDFYDRDRMAAWASTYPGVALWVREQVGEAVVGWCGHGTWAYGDKPDSKYLSHDTRRLIFEHSRVDGGDTVIDGIERIRKILSEPRGIVRLVGLSGVGKTRLAQALFDPGVGAGTLDTALAIYTDEGALAPEPSPREMLNRLVACRTRVIVIVDNCNSAMHRALTQIANSEQSRISLLTIEFDVADDEPEETEVFRLEPASEETIVQVLQSLRPEVSQTNQRRIAEFSGGNARVALALARAIVHHESVAVLSDAQLMERLVNQHRTTSEGLMRAAEVCSLFYSFEGEQTGGDGAELPILAGLASTPTADLYRYVAEMRDRDVVQQRGRWRAVLPHAIANRLAVSALKKTPSESIVSVLQQPGCERLFRSFTRRLSLLHDSPQAIAIAKDLLTQRFADILPSDEYCFELLRNLAPLAPTLALQLIEDAWAQHSGAALNLTYITRWRLAMLLRTLAYEPAYFDRAVGILAELYADEGQNHLHYSVRDSFLELFHLCLSGTHAAITQRSALIRKLLKDTREVIRTSATNALEAMLQAGHFSSSHDFTFGARPRDYGWMPKTDADRKAWFAEALSLLRELQQAGGADGTKARRILATHFEELWMSGRVFDELLTTVRTFAAAKPWSEMWIAVRRTLRLRRKQMSISLAAKLDLLEKELMPAKLADRLDAYVLAQSSSGLDIADSVDTDLSATLERHSEIVEGLGREAAESLDVLSDFVPKILRNVSSNAKVFGRGLALGAADMKRLWQHLRAHVEDSSEPQQCYFGVLCGFINGAAACDPVAVQEILEESIEDPVLGPVFPMLQSSLPIDQNAIARLIRSTRIGLAPAAAFAHLGARTANGSTVGAAGLGELLLAVAALAAGTPAALEILGMHFHGRTAEAPTDAVLVDVGRKLLKQFDFARVGSFGYLVDQVARVCLSGTDGYEAAATIARNFAAAVTRAADADCYAELAGTLFRLQPNAALDNLLPTDNSPSSYPYHAIVGPRGNPLREANAEAVFAWADANPGTRYPQLAQVVDFFDPSLDGSESTVSQVMLRLIDRAPDARSVLQRITPRLRPTHWGGSWANALMPYVNFLQKLAEHPNVTVAHWAVDQEQRLRDQIAKERETEDSSDKSFE